MEIISKLCATKNNMIMRILTFLAILLFCSCSYQKGDGISEGKYEGDIVNGKRHGIGKLETSHGIYIGEFNEDYVTGYGEFKGNDGGSYQGFWLNQEWQGPGMAVWPSGDRCMCEFKHDKMHGFASYTRNTGGKYIGYYDNGIKSGVGMIEFVSEKRKGDIYIGEIENDYMQGLGKYYFANGDSEEGIFKENRLVSPKTFTKNDSIRIMTLINKDFERVSNELSEIKK